MRLQEEHRESAEQQSKLGSNIGLYTRLRKIAYENSHWRLAYDCNEHVGYVSGICNFTEGEVIGKRMYLDDDMQTR